MISARQLLRFLTLSIALLFVSCIDGREEIWIRADGSGRADITYTLPAAAARFQGGEVGVRRMIGDFLKGTPAITTYDHEVSTTGDRLKIRVRASFDSVLELKEIPSAGSIDRLPSSAMGLTGKVAVEIRGLNIDFARTIKAGDALPGSAYFPGTPFKDRSLTYIIHLPNAAIDSNASRIENEGRTLIWEFPLGQAVKMPFTTHFKAKIPVPRWVYASAGAVVGLVMLLGIGKLRARKR